MSIFLSLTAAAYACSVQGHYPPMYGIWFSCVGGSTYTALLNRVQSKAFRLINSPPRTDCLDSLSHQRNVASLSIFYRYFHGVCSSELTNCMPPPPPRQPRCTRLSTSSHPYFVNLSNARVIFILSSLTLVNFETLFLCLFFHLPLT